jgi:Xaa-Pro dipeptidase
MTTQSIFQKRREQLINPASARGVDTLIVSNPTNIFYFTGIHVTPYERFIAFILNAQTGQCYMVLPSLEKGTSVDTSIEVILYEDHENPFHRLKDLLAGCHSVGVEKGVMPVGVAEEMAGLIQAKGADTDLFVDITLLPAGLRTQKSPDEIAAVQRAAEISDMLLSRISEILKPGRTEKQIAFALLEKMAEEADVTIEPFVIQVLGGERSANPHGTSSNRLLKPGDAVTVDFGVCYKGYWSDCTRTFFIGAPPQMMKTIYPIVLEAQAAAIETIRPGVPVQEVDAAARRVIHAAGFGPHFIHRTGHGIGLDIHEGPSVHGLNTALLEEGMVITVEPGIYLPGIGGVRIEDDIVVTPDGYQVLTRYPKSFEMMIIGMEASPHQREL